jgi:hypothetical protein
MARTKETTVTVDNKIVKDSSITKIFNTVSKKLIKIGVPIPVKDIKKVGELKTRSKRVRGVTYTFKRIAYNNINIGKTNYIGINKKLIDEDFEIEKTMAHELIHTIPGCSNHGPNFKRYAELINRHYPEYNVSTYYTPDSDEIENIANIKKPKYVVTCENCGVKTYFYRKCKTLDILSRCTCKKCKTSNFKVESLV